MNVDKIEKIFVSTMLEIAEIVKSNTIGSNMKQILNLISFIIEIHKKNNLVFVYGAGRSGFIGRCFAQRLMHLGLRSCFISDAITYRYTNDDLLILISGSGETTSPVAIAKKAREIGGKIVLFTTKSKSTIGNLSDLVIQVKGKSKDDAITKETLAPYTSLFDISTLSVLDSIGSVLMEILNVSENDINNRHTSIE
ncbi:MAG: SIS domain-containing protein [Promethearchaeota archaeon]